MTRARAVLVLVFVLGAVGCAHREWPRGSATATLFGPDPRLDAWTTSVIEGIHVHSARPEEPCTAASLQEVTSAISVAAGEKRDDLKDAFKDMGRSMGTLMEALMVQTGGPAHGGPDRTVLALRRPAGEESIIVDLPRLKADEKERTFKAGDFKAVYERPALTAEAHVARGWVRAVRVDSGGMEYDLFLVLKPVRPGAYESLLVVTRVEWPPR